MDSADVCYSIDLSEAQARAAKRWMLRNLGEYVDECMEIASTRLAEDCAEALSLYGPDGVAILHEVFDLAADRGVGEAVLLCGCGTPAETGATGLDAGLCVDCQFARLGGE